MGEKAPVLPETIMKECCKARFPCGKYQKLETGHKRSSLLHFRGVIGLS